jgi:hypothetical protein
MSTGPVTTLHRWWYIIIRFIERSLLRGFLACSA